MLDPVTFEAYFAARLAFVDRPQVRISTRDERWWRLVVRMEDTRGWMEYGLDRDLAGGAQLVVAEAARQARRKWEIREQLAEPREAFDMRKLREHVSRVAATTGACDLVVRDAWGSELAMRLEPLSVVVSPEVHRRVLLEQRAFERDHGLAAWFRSGVV